VTGFCPCCGAAVALDVPPLTPTQMRLLLTINRTGDDGIDIAALAAETDVDPRHMKVQVNRMRDRLSGSGVGIETMRRGRHPARYRIVRGDY